MAVKKAVDPAVSLAKAVVEHLVRRRSEKAGYPALLREVARDVAPDISETDLRAALAKAPLKSCVLALDGDLDSLSVLKDKEDIELLASNERVLRSICEKMCSPQCPTLDLASGSKLLSTALRKPFVTVWQDRIAAGRLPDFVRAVLPAKAKGQTKLKPVLHDVRFPLPWVDLSERLVREMERCQGQGELLVEWSSLLSAVGPSDAGVLQRARETEPIRSRVVPIFIKEAEGLVVLAENAERCASDPRILDRLTRTALIAGDTAVDVAKLKGQAVLKLLSPQIAKAFSQTVDRMTSGDGVPKGYGLIRVAKKTYLFRLSDICGMANTDDRSRSLHGQTSDASAHSNAHEEEFAPAFREAFDRLDAREGGYNFVKLLHLRNALPRYPRPVFDAELEALRKERKFSLESSEGHLVSLTEQEREAGIMESGRQLIYCKRVRSV